MHFRCMHSLIQSEDYHLYSSHFQCRQGLLAAAVALTGMFVLLTSIQPTEAGQEKREQERGMDVRKGCLYSDGGFFQTATAPFASTRLRSSQSGQAPVSSQREATVHHITGK